MAFIEIKNLEFSYPLEKEKTLKNINMSIEKGSFVMLLGKSGSGKSTLGRAIVGTVPEFYGGTIKGEIKIDDKSIREISHKERAKKVTMVFQDPEKQLMMNKTHREIAFGLENVGTEENTIKRHVYEAMQFCGILHLCNRDVTSLSGGEKQKVAVAAALSYMPECIIFDEPTSQLDPSAAEEILNIIKKINSEMGITVIIIEQRINKCFDDADTIGIMDNGSLNLYKDKEEFYNSCSEYEFMFLPDYLKFLKRINWECVPKNFKDARNKILKSNISFKNKPCDNNINSKMNNESEKNIECGHSDNDDIILRAKKVSSFYDSKMILDNISFEIKKGEFISIMGANGAGKTTLLKCIMGLKEFKGKMDLYDKSIKKLSIRDIARHIGYVSQNPNDYLSKDTVYDELKFTMDNYGIYDKNTIEEILKELEIYHLKDKNPRDLSGGERQRVAVASILVLKPEVILLDEPTRGLETSLKLKLGEILTKLNKKGTSIILVTHDTDFACTFCKRFILMFNGIIVSDGTRKEVLENGLFYTTSINKLLRQKDKSIFTLQEALRKCVL